MDEKKPLDRRTMFEKHIKPILSYIGFIGSILMVLVYIVIVLIMIFGFKAGKSLKQSIIFASVNAVVGLIIMQFLKIQGVDFAKQIPENKEITDKYYTTDTKDKKFKSMTHFWWTSVLKDVIVKGISIIVSTVGLIYIVIEGSQDYNLLLLALVNLIMFICFGLLSLVKAYDFYNQSHIPYIVKQLKIKEEKDVIN